MRMLKLLRAEVIARLILLTIPLLCSSLASAQSNPAPARKFDEFGDIQYSDLIARLDNFAIQLQNQPATKGFILVYRTRRDLPGLNHSLALRSKDYLVNTRGMRRERIVTVDGGEADCMSQELWIVPAGTAPTQRGDAYQRYFPDLDTPRKFYEYYFEAQEREPSDTFIDRASSAEYLEAFAGQLRKEPRASACIIVYAQYNPRPGLVDSGNYEPVPDVKLDPVAVASRRLALEKKRLTEVYGVAPNRITLVNGGYRKQRAVELWIVPRGEHLPVATPNSYPAKTLRKAGP
jgi:hypothetical protein